MNTQSPQIILASQSPQRKIMMDALAKQLSFEYQILPADIDELAVQGPTQHERAALVAQAKGNAIVDSLQKNSKANQNWAVIAADTYLADHADKALEKPQTKQEAIQMLQYQSGKTITEYTGVFWFDTITKKAVSQTYSTQVTFLDLSKKEIENYVANEPVLTYSGAFCPAYPSGSILIKRIEGSLTGFTHGFPAEFFRPKLQSFLKK